MKTIQRAALPERSEFPARRRLFEVALALFSRDGYNGVSVRDIVGELGQQPTAIYAHVKTQAGSALRTGQDGLRGAA